MLVEKMIMNDLFTFSLFLKNKKNVCSGSTEPVNFDLRECPESALAQDWQNAIPDKFQDFIFDLTIVVNCFSLL